MLAGGRLPSKSGEEFERKRCKFHKDWLHPDTVHHLLARLTTMNSPVCFQRRVRRSTLRMRLNLCVSRHVRFEKVVCHTNGLVFLQGGGCDPKMAARVAQVRDTRIFRPLLLKSSIASMTFTQQSALPRPSCAIHASPVPPCSAGSSPYRSGVHRRSVRGRRPDGLPLRQGGRLRSHHRGLGPRAKDYAPRRELPTTPPPPPPPRSASHAIFSMPQQILLRRQQHRHC